MSRRLFAALCSLLVLAAACGAGTDRAADTDLPVVTFADQGRDHLAPDDPLPGYNSDPATSGPHTPEWAPCGIYTEPIPDPFLVHTMEHGAVVVHYDPAALDPDDVATLRDLARDLGTHIVVAPREGLGAPVVLTAWGVMLELDGVEVDAIRAFWQAYAQEGPERGVPCPIEVDQAA